MWINSRRIRVTDSVSEQIIGKSNLKINLIIQHRKKNRIKQ